MNREGIVVEYYGILLC